jgi:myo-inositol-1(or 4)-monophosphatase
MTSHLSSRRFLTKSPIVNVMAGAATRAGRFLIKDFNEIDKLKVSKKGVRDFVSNADTFAEKNIREELESARPGFGFLLEESGEIPGKDPKNRWIVDPLDGTFNFLHGFPHFCISIAHEKEGEIQAGVIYLPLTDEIFWAEKGGGAFLNFTRLRVSARDDLDTMLVATAPSKHFDKTVETFGSVRITGSTALDLAYVAAGKFDGFFINRFSPWDIAAGMLLIREAGGYTESYDGKTSPFESKNIIAGSQEAFPILTKLVRSDL